MTAWLYTDLGDSKKRLSECEARFVVAAVYGGRALKDDRIVLSVDSTEQIKPFDKPMA